MDQNFQAISRQFPITGANLAGVMLAVGSLSKVACGSVELEWSGANPLSNTKEVTHGLGKTPSDVHMQLDTLISTPGNGGMITFGVERGATVFKVNATFPTGSTPGAGTKVKFTWTAIG